MPADRPLPLWAWRTAALLGILLVALSLRTSSLSILDSDDGTRYRATIQGVTVQKKSTAILLFVTLTSPELVFPRP